ncbi:MAG: c-type cytochrome [Gammaproteobacteria bacterium]|nr:c-type cytochrome [Gammaproteobacteria bacterium]
MKKLLMLTAATTTLLLAGCSRDYTPAAGATGEDIFKGACLECHEAIEGKDNVYYELANDKKNAEFFAKKISSGSLMMPKFPNITGDNLKAVSQYALEHSASK